MEAETVPSLSPLIIGADQWHEFLLLLPLLVALEAILSADNAIAKSYVNYVLDTCAPEVAEIKGYSALPASLVTISKAIAAKIGA